MMILKWGGDLKQIVPIDIAAGRGAAGVALIIVAGRYDNPGSIIECLLGRARVVEIRMRAAA